MPDFLAFDPTASPLPPDSSGLYYQVTQWVASLVNGLSNALIQIGHGIASLPAQVQVPTTLDTTEAWHLALYWLLVLVMGVGVVGAVVPALPGITLIVGAIVIWGLVVGFVGLKWALGVAIAALVLSFAIDYLAGVLGAQRVGASNWGQIGAFVGMFLGLFGLLPLLPTGIPLLGLLVGTVLGAFIGEFLHRRELKLLQRVKQSAKVGLAIVVGTLVGNILQGVLALISLIVFLVTTWPGSWA
ncbi:DUF456 domain-containing protein [Leptolyngbya sp. CCNP1308]|uniref:DUF456 domain-containing protein n=1 Tax=Leptolyngbya sp. CCNP1308 TaxID=3110255 RepID=UPI002B201B6E|nr:DUF456 domain-containing protein [Leptolyngbya sp. CCNP1308]MEA5451200.1 DUF456 domain-containing protein [Leptolyngbya sp. CCNP1308]